MSIQTTLRNAFATACAAILLVAAPASATVVEQGRFVDETYGFSYDCGFPVEVTGVATGNYRLRAGNPGAPGAFFALDRVSYREVHTNPDTGAWFTIRGRFASNELTATHVAGSVYEFRVIKAGQPAIFEDSAGNLVARDRGAMRQTFLFDTGGDDVPGGTFVELLDFQLDGPHAAFGERCSIAAKLIG